LAILRTNVESDPSPKFQDAYDEVAQRLRDIVTELRPPMLNYGLKLALEDLAENLAERNENSAQVSSSIQAGEERYSPQIEQHIYRIVQEACENALRHAGAKKLTISGKLDEFSIEIEIEDDGAGFNAGEGFELDDLLANKHFGLAGMMERANLIGAQLNISSTPATGTRVRLMWSRVPPERSA